MITTNYGLAGGTLDSTELIRKAIPKLLFPEELSLYQAKEQAQRMRDTEFNRRAARSRNN